MPEYLLMVKEMRILYNSKNEYYKVIRDVKKFKNVKKLQ